jgi:sensor domain CHASE-containing protein
MKIRYKILLILFLVTFILLASLLTLSQTAMLNGVYESEKQHSIQSAQRFERNLDIALSNIDNTVNDWANWDDTYNFVENNNTAYQESNIVDSTFKNLRLNMMLFF